MLRLGLRSAIPVEEHRKGVGKECGMHKRSAGGN